MRDFFHLFGEGLLQAFFYLFSGIFRRIGLLLLMPLTLFQKSYAELKVAYQDSILPYFLATIFLIVVATIIHNWALIMTYF